MAQNPFYPNGFENLPNETTPITAEVLDYIYASLQSKNLLINGNFDIWQRGTSFAAASYNADRWWTPSGDPQIDQVANTRTDGGGGQYVLQVSNFSASVLQQIMENVTSLFYGKNVTLSFYVKGSSNTTLTSRLRDFSGNYDQSVVYSVSTSWEKVEVTFSSSTSWNLNENARLYLLSNNTFSGTIQFSEVKLEIGDTATEFIPKTEAEELRDCQRYYWQGFAIGNGTGQYYALAGATNMQSAVVRFPVKMRVIPTVSYTGGTFTNCTHGSLSTSDNGLVHRVNVTTSNIYRVFNAEYIADAEI